LAFELQQHRPSEHYENRPLWELCAWAEALGQRDATTLLKEALEDTAALAGLPSRSE
jgi:ferritin-like metal-binding protein YciE